MTSATDALTETARTEYGRMVGILASWCGNLELAEDALQDAMTRALEKWTEDGVPNSPAAWLLTAARRRIIDVGRRSKLHREKVDLIGVTAPSSAAPDLAEELDAFEDKRVELLFACCHPALKPQDQIALTLKVVVGLETPEVARAMLMSSSGLAQRIVRAKRRLAEEDVAFAIPEPDDRPARLGAVLRVLYLLYNEAYVATKGEYQRVDLADESRHLLSVVLRRLPDEPEALGLLALIEFHDSRRDARIDASGALVTLEDQDRSTWDAGKIARGQALLGRALARRRPGPYQLQAAISALHAEAKSWAETDFAQIVLLYDELYRREPSPIVALNAAVAVLNASGPDAALVRLESVAEHLQDYAPFWVTRAEIMRRLGDTAKSADSLHRAINLTQNEVERVHLRKRLKELTN